MNADGLLGANQDLLSYNLFAYCSNNPIVFSDPTGCVIKEAAAILIVGATIGALAILSGLGVAGAQTAQQQLQGKLDRAWNTRINAAQELIGYPSATISRAAERDQEIAISSPPDSEYNYWAATRVGSNIAITTPLTVEQAAARVALGKSVMCRNQVAALHIVFINGYVNAVGPERGTGEGFYWHYHPTRNHTEYDSIHIWFYGEPIDKKLSTH